jgi:hypothetical protein
MTQRKFLSDCNVSPVVGRMLLGVALASCALIPTALCQSAAPAANQPPAGAAAPAVGTQATKPAADAISPRNRPNRFAGKAGRFYALFWGIDSPTVKATESGELIRFSYRVLDADKAKNLNDKKIEAYLISPSAGVRLSVPSLEKIGQLRQSPTPEAGKTYWMAFSNPGRRVKPGDRVNVVIGNFQAQGLVVE